MPPIPRLTGLGLLTAAGTLACIATLAGFAGRFWWGFELASHFRVQYAVALGLGALTILAWRCTRWAVVFAVFALFNAALLVPRFLPPSEALAGTDGRLLRALLANVNSANRDHERIRRAIIAYDPDFVVLLETTPWLLDRLTDFASRYPYRTAAPREDNFGIALFSRRPFLRADIVQLGASELPSIIAEFAVDGHRFSLLGTHPLPPVGAKQARDRNDQLAQLAAFARQTRQPLLLLGLLQRSNTARILNCEANPATVVVAGRSEHLALVAALRTVARRLRPARQRARARHPAVLAGRLALIVDSDRPCAILGGNPAPASGNWLPPRFRPLPGHC